MAPLRKKALAKEAVESDCATFERMNWRRVFFLLLLGILIGLVVFHDA
jgi:hypothetical protein